MCSLIDCNESNFNLYTRRRLNSYFKLPFCHPLETRIVFEAAGCYLLQKTRALGEDSKPATNLDKRNIEVAARFGHVEGNRDIRPRRRNERRCVGRNANAAHVGRRRRWRLVDLEMRRFRRLAAAACEHRLKRVNRVGEQRRRKRARRRHC